MLPHTAEHDASSIVSSTIQVNHFSCEFRIQSAGWRTPAFSTETLGPSNGPEIFRTWPFPNSAVLRSLLLRVLAVSIANSAFRPKLKDPLTSVRSFPPSSFKSSRKILWPFTRNEPVPAAQREIPVCAAPSATLALTSHPRSSTLLR